MKSLNEYRNFAMAHWGYNEREADIWAEEAIKADEKNREMVAMQGGKIFRTRIMEWKLAERAREEKLWDLPE